MGFLKKQEIRRGLTAMLLFAVLALAACSGHNRQNASDWAGDAVEPDTLSVMSFNVLLGGRPAGDVLDAIAAASADLVCLQEMTPDFADLFEARFASVYPHRVLVPGPGVHGIGLAGRFPLTDARLLTLGLPYLPAVASTMQTAAGPVRVACVHLVPPLARFGGYDSMTDRYYLNRSIRMDQARALLQHIDSAAMPAIVVGDMNEWEGQAALAILAEAGFRNACGVPGSRCAATWPGDVGYGLAIARVDHILGRGVEFRRAAVLNAGGSDHYPVVARFALMPGAP